MSGRKQIYKTHKVDTRPPFECIALLLQGGGALGAYQGGVYQALAEAGIHPDWVAGISIGSINSAIVAGNPPDKRVDKLREFWELVTANSIWDSLSDYTQKVAKGDVSHAFLNQITAVASIMSGVPGFFRPRLISPWLQQEGAIEATSYYNTDPLKETLTRLIDFDRINSGETRLSMGAVNIRNGNFVYFDTTTDVIRLEHIMASGALPPGFPAVEIDGEYYWDGGLVSNTPLDWVLGNKVRQDTLTFQVDLWSARGNLPRNMAEVMTREKEIQFSSRTRAATDNFRTLQRRRHMLVKFFDQLPDDLKKSPEAKQIAALTDHKVYNIIHLIYHSRGYEGDSKDYEFSRLSMEEHWKAGYDDTVRTLRHPEVLERPTNHEGVFTFDVADEDHG